jgi:hypothetical protein
LWISHSEYLTLNGERRYTAPHPSRERAGVAKEPFTYSEALERLGKNRKHIFLGNGFSIGCDPVFRYSSLYEAAVKAGLSSRAQKVFERLGTNNFEGAMRLLDDSHWVAETYGLTGAAPMLEDVEVIKHTLVEAVATSHLRDTSCVPEAKKQKALAFLSQYYNVFTTNYDLLTYWVNMSDPKPRWGDGFRADEDDPDAEYLVFSERMGDTSGLFYLHGALHLYVVDGELRKHSWIRTGRPLTALIKDGLDRKQYPLFVAEGSPDRKLEQIQRNGYLWYCLQKFSEIQSPLLVFGHSLGGSDGHIAEAIARNPKLPLLAVGLHGDPESPANRAIVDTVSRMQAQRAKLADRRKGVRELEVIYYQSESSPVWE